MPFVALGPMLICMELLELRRPIANDCVKLHFVLVCLLYHDAVGANVVFGEIDWINELVVVALHRIESSQE